MGGFVFAPALENGKPVKSQITFAARVRTANEAVAASPPVVLAAQKSSQPFAFVDFISDGHGKWSVRFGGAPVPAAPHD
jgi:hypothetical protein